MKKSSEKVTQRNRENAKKRLIDLTNKKCNYLTGIERVFSQCRETMWKFICDCGKETIANGSHVRRGNIVSCGCYNLKLNKKRMEGNVLGLKHGLANHPLRAIRKAMIDRCKNNKNKFFLTYGGRGISVCEEWEKSLESFYEWSLKAGWKKGLSIDRIDNDGNYTPENCHWITVSENSRKNMKRLWKEDKWKRKKL